METSTIALLVCAGYLLLTLGTGLISGRKATNSVAGYVAGDRSLNVVVLYFVIGASIFSAFAFLGAPGWAYSRGAAAFYILAFGTVGMIPLYFFGPHARRIGAKLGFVTQAELLSHRYNSKPLSVLLALVTIAVLVPYLTIQMKGAAYILSVISDGLIPEWLGALIPYAVVVLYVLTSGVLGVGWTNTLQGAFMLIIAWFLGLYLPYELYGGIGPMFEQLAASDHADLLTAPGRDARGEPWNWWAYSSAVLVSAVGFTMWPHLFMKAYTAKSERALRLSVVLYPTFQLFLIPILLIGFAGVLAFPGVSPADTIVPYILTQLDFSPIFIGLVAAGTLAASMSSGDSILHAAASVGIRDGIRPWQDLTDRQERRAIQILVVLLSVVAYYFAVVSEVSLVTILLASYGGIAQLFPLVFAAFYWPRATGVGALAGLLVGLGVSVFFLMEPDLRPLPLHEGVYGLAANLAVFIAVSLLTRPEAMSRLHHYMSR
ncbi:MAG: sodium:solute symporter family protein [Rhodothermales bacterium]